MSEAITVRTDKIIERILTLELVRVTERAAVASPPAPGPTSVISRTASASMVTALVTPMTSAMAAPFATIVG